MTYHTASCHLVSHAQEKSCYDEAMARKQTHPADVLVWSSNLWNFADGLLGPLFAVFAQKVGGNILDISWAWGIYLVAMGVFIIIVGFVSDRMPKLPILFSGYILTAALTFCYLFVSTPTQLFVLQGAMGFALALTNPTHYALYARYVREKKGDGVQWGLADGRDKIATGLAVFAGGVLVTATSFEVLFITMGVLQIGVAAYLAQLFWRDVR